MEQDSPSKPSVAELAGRFKGHALPMPGSNEEKPIRRRPPCSLRLNTQKHADNHDGDSDKPTVVSPLPFKVKMRNSAMIEMLQANLALSPTALLPSPKSPDVKLQPPTLSPTNSSPSPATSPLSPTAPRPSLLSSEEEEHVSFESPPEGPPLPSINKSRARLSFKRRPPTRQHRRSCGDGDNLSPGGDPPSPKANGDEEKVFTDSPTGGEEEGGPERGGGGGGGRRGDEPKPQEDTLKEPEGRGGGGGQEKDSTKAEDKVDPCPLEGAGRAPPDGQTSSSGAQEAAAEAAAQTLEVLPEEQQQQQKERPQCEGNETTAGCEPPRHY